MRLDWGAVGERFFETGIDQGVLYLPSQAGVPWTGLISVSENPSGGEAKPYYIDGTKYLNVASAEEYEATINALGSPKEFGLCDGNVSIHPGLFVTRQPRRPFGLSYRTLLGNDLNGSNHGYKIHLVYNALAAPSQRTNNTLNNSGDPSTFSWNITTKPPSITGYKPTAHLVIDSRFTDLEKMAAVQDLLYGTDEDDPTLPTPDELIAVFEDS